MNYATADATAQTPADYGAASGTLSFAPGVTSLQITVPVAGDVLDEVNETFNVNLSGATNATIGDALGVGTITDDDATPTLAINNVSINEPVTGTATAVLTVTLSTVSGRTVTVNYTTANASATRRPTIPHKRYANVRCRGHDATDHGSGAARRAR